MYSTERGRAIRELEMCLFGGDIEASNCQRPVRPLSGSDVTDGLEVLSGDTLLTQKSAKPKCYH